ncbi:MurR/RpiR family transcriptional regulator [Leucothrix sargassi]|nr:MurR/RpiR family transcriptional regulator [Leucothrix sargassi]
MTNKKHITLESIIAKHYDELPTAERKLADTVLEFPGELAAYNATELAEIAGVSKAAATRFFQRLGFSNFEEARRLARDSKNWGSPLYLQSKDSQTGSTVQRLAQYVDEETNNLQHTFNSPALAELDEITEQLVKAKRVFLLGYRNSHYIASYARWQFIQFRSDVHLLPSNAGETMAEHIADLRPDDVVIVIGVRRRVKKLIDIMQAIKQTQAPILYLTDPTASKTSAYAKWTIKIPVSSSFLFDSYTSLMSFTRFLAIETFQASGEAGRNHLKNIENIHDNLNEFE